ncbi:MAG: MBL fold metallo-hydrolase [Candidatus Nanohaloarchaea archaeon]|nr:MBL fold metallo-hydrolase [Candidatus Nanohaloarchaea archaeon]
MQIDNLAEDADSFTANAFLLSETALIDTGSDPIVLERLDSIYQVAITHTHHDHIENLPQIVDQHSPTIYAYEPDNLPVDAEQVQDRDNIDLAGSSFNILHTPGHKDDSICLFHEKSGTLFSGDLIFPDGSFGRTDLEEGNRDTLIKSIERITRLDVQALYPGHDSPTTTEVNQQIQQSLKEAKKREPKY